MWRSLAQAKQAPRLKRIPPCSRLFRQTGIPESGLPRPAGRLAACRAAGLPPATAALVPLRRLRGCPALAGHAPCDPSALLPLYRTRFLGHTFTLRGLTQLVFLARFERRAVRQLLEALAPVVDAPRLVSSDASPTRPECAVTRLSTPAACAAAVNRNPIICADNGTTRSPSPPVTGQHPGRTLAGRGRLPGQLRAEARRGDRRRSARRGASRIVELAEVRSETRIVELAPLEPSVELAERAGVGPPCVRADGGLDQPAGGLSRAAWPRPRVESNKHEADSVTYAA